MSLVTLGEVEGFLQGTVREEDQPLLEAVIAAVGIAFANHTHREFEPKADEERRFAHARGKILDVAPFDLRTVTEVRTGVEGEGPTTLAASDYKLRPLPARDGVYQRLKLARDPGECEVAVKGDWGFASVPADVKHWAKTQIALWLRRDIQAFERTFNIDAGFFERPEALASAVRGGLGSYRRLVGP